MSLEIMLKTFEKHSEKDAIIRKGQSYNYRWLLDRIDFWTDTIHQKNISPGTVTIIEADFSPNSVALLLALIQHQCILVPLTSAANANRPEFIEIAQGEISFIIDQEDQCQIEKLPYSADHEFYQQLKQLNHPGLVLFSSGSTGKSKAAVHNLNKILEKFKVPRHSLRTITFLLYDHIGGINTLFYTLSNSGCLITLQSRTPDETLEAIDKYQAELLPTSPTFINLILLSEVYKRYSLKSLKTVTYGTEPMPESTLKRFHELFPHIRLLQTYGLSELGILRSKSKSSDSLWVKIGGEGFQTRIVDGILQIKAHSAMLGYLNAASPFTEDGWFNTNDAVQVNGEFIKILGRQSEIINVGGEKVYPAEVENVIQEMENVSEVTIYGEENFITGNIVCAKVSLTHHEETKLFIVRLKKFCGESLETFKIPVKVKVTYEPLYSERFKKVRAVKP